MSLNPLLKFYTTLIRHLNVQQYSFNPMYGKPALEKSNPKVRSFASYQKKSFQQRNTKISEGTPKVSVHQPLCYLLILFPTPSTSSVTRTPQNTAEDPKDPEPADLGDIHMK